MYVLLACRCLLYTMFYCIINIQVKESAQTYYLGDLPSAMPLIDVPGAY